MKLVNQKEIIFFSVICALAIAFISSQGWINSLRSNIDTAMTVRPLSKYYFLTFTIFTIITPLFFRFASNTDQINKKAIDLYLSLVIGQVITEILLIYLFNKELGVIVGLCFSCARVLQLFQIKKTFLLTSRFLLLFELETLLWTYNIAQIINNRILT